MVQEEIALAKFCRDPAIAVPAHVFVVNRCDFFLVTLVLSANIFASAVRDAFDPRAAGRGRA